MTVEALVGRVSVWLYGLIRELDPGLYLPNPVVKGGVSRLESNEIPSYMSAEANAAAIFVPRGVEDPPPLLGRGIRETRDPFGEIPTGPIHARCALEGDRLWVDFHASSPLIIPS